MKIDRTNVWAYVQEIEPDEQKLLEKSLTFFDSKAKYSWLYKAKRWDGKYRLFYKKDKSFPAGLIPIIKNIFKKNKKEFICEDKRNDNVLVDEDEDISWLRDYQQEAYDAILKSRNGIIQAGTGAGKTSCAIAIMKTIKHKWIFFAHKKDLIHQAGKRFKDTTGEEIGIIGDGKFETDKRIIFATFQTLNSALKRKEEEVLKLISETKGIIVDEAHCASAKTFWKIIMLFENAVYRVGLSATPLAKDKKDNVYVMSGLGPVRYKITSKELIERGFLSKPIIEMHEVFQEFEDKKNIKKHKWHDVNQKYIISSLKRNKKIIELTKKAPKPCLVFVNIKEHGNHLNEEINKAGINSKFIYGDDKTKERQEGLKDLVEGKLNVIVCSSIFNEGIDIPSLESVIIGNGGKSIINTLQKLGRGMRKTACKDKFFVYDIFDGADGHPWLYHQSRKRLKTFQDEGFEVEIIKENDKKN